MGNCFKCFEKEDDQQQLIDSDEGEYREIDLFDVLLEHDNFLESQNELIIENNTKSTIAIQIKN